MKLNRLALRNFKAHREFEIEPYGADLNIYGDNAVGKTTLADAYTWVLTGKDSLGRADFGIKTTDEAGNAIPKLDHSVEAEFDLGGGKSLTLNRTYKEDWTKKRGSATESFSGHVTEYEVNGVPVQAQEYNAQVAAICPPKQFELLTNTRTFAALHWQDRRKMLLGLVGDLSDEAVIASNRELEELPEILAGRTCEDYKKVATASRLKIAEELKSIPARIDEATRGISEAGMPVLIEPIRTELRKLIEERAETAAGGALAAEKRSKAQFELKRLELETNLRGQPNPEREKTQAAADEAHRLWMDAARAQHDAEAVLDDLKFHLAREAAQRGRLRTEYADANSLTFAVPDGSTCSACGQLLPLERIEETFNSAKAERLERIKKEGVQAKSACDELEKRIAEFEPTVKVAQEKAALIKVDLEKLQSLARSQVSAPVDPAKNEEWQRLTGYIEKSDGNIKRLELGLKVALAEIDGKIAEAQERLDQAAHTNAAIEESKRAAARVEELESREKELLIQHEELSRHLYLIETFTRAKCSLLTDSINARFTLARFKLFDIQVNGGIAECCTITIAGREDLSSAERVNVGLDIIETFAKEAGFAPPIFIDNAESVTRVLPTSGQQIRLVVSKPDKALRVEKAASKELLFA